MSRKVQQDEDPSYDNYYDNSEHETARHLDNILGPSLFEDENGAYEVTVSGGALEEFLDMFSVYVDPTYDDIVIESDDEEPLIIADD